MHKFQSSISKPLHMTGWQQSKSPQAEQVYRTWTKQLYICSKQSVCSKSHDSGPSKKCAPFFYRKAIATTDPAVFEPLRSGSDQLQPNNLDKQNMCTPFLTEGLWQPQYWKSWKFFLGGAVVQLCKSVNKIQNCSAW